MSVATETPGAGAVEVWQIFNLTGDTHPIHVQVPFRSRSQPGWCWALMLLIFEALLDTVVVSGLQYVGEVLEEERTELCGVRYCHDAERRATRAGWMASSLTLGGRRVQVGRPRVRPCFRCSRSR
jgi:hypothetical protein